MRAISLVAVGILAPAIAMAEADVPAQEPAPTKAADAAKPATPDATAATEEEPVSSLPTGIVCMVPLGIQPGETEDGATDFQVEFRIDSGNRAEGHRGARVVLTAPRKHRIRIYAGETLLQSFNIELSKYSRPYLKMRKKDGFETWVLRQMRNGGCPYPEPNLISANASKPKG